MNIIDNVKLTLQRTYFSKQIKLQKYACQGRIYRTGAVLIVSLGKTSATFFFCCEKGKCIEAQP